MRCKACDALLSDHMATLKTSEGDYNDLCGGCLAVSKEAQNEDIDIFRWDVGVDHEAEDLNSFAPTLDFEGESMV